MFLRGMRFFNSWCVTWLSVEYSTFDVLRASFYEIGICDESDTEMTAYQKCVAHHTERGTFHAALGSVQCETVRKEQMNRSVQ